MKSKYFKLIMLSQFALFLTACGEVTTKVTIHDETGKPIEGAEVEAIYVGSLDDNVVTKKSNKKGVAKFKGKADLGVELSVRKLGYYESLSKRLSQNSNHDLRIVLRKKINPIPLYAKKVETFIPSLKEKVGFDLKLGDWVMPHGRGKVADFYVKAKKFYIDGDHYTTSVVVSFGNKREGMLQDEYIEKNKEVFSQFKTAREAPNLKQYDTSYTFIRTRSKDKGTEGSIPPSNFVIRTRVKLNNEGKIASCNYGKLVKAFDVAKGSGKPNQKPIIKFTYYFNPTPNDRNLEFDPNKNLFKNLKHDEKVRQP